MRRLLSSAELAARVRSGVDPLGSQAVAVNLDAEPATLCAALTEQRAQRGVTIGVTASGALRPELLELCDTVLVSGTARIPGTVAVADPAAAAARMLECIAVRQQTTAVLSDTLRVTERLPVLDGIAAESLAYSALLTGGEFASWLDQRIPRPARDSHRVPLRIERTGDELVVTLDDPARRNAYSAAMRDALVSALDVAASDPSISRVVITGAGPVFCAGGDLAEFGLNRDGTASHLLRTRAGAATPLCRISDRVEVRVHGACIGAGIELPAFAGRIVAHPETTFRLPEVAMGLIPGAGGTVSITRRIGRHRMFWLAVTGEPLSAERALAWGLIDAIDPAFELPTATDSARTTGSDEP